MTLSVEQKAEVIKNNAINATDTGSAPVQVALITARVNQLQDHFKANKKDHHSLRGLMQLVGRRRRLLEYIKKQDVQAYRSLIEKLGIRK